MITMIRLFQLKRVLSALGGRRRAALESKRPASEIQDAIERVVAGTEPNIRSVHGYRKKLQDAVTTALDYTEQLVDQLPAPIEINTSAFVQDPRVNALFANADELRAVFFHSQELQAFFRDIQSTELDTGYALLCSSRTQKTVLGSTLANGAVQREVLQTAINFSDHKLLSPAASAAEVRQGIKNCMFEGLITYALQHIVEHKTRQRGLDDEIRILDARLRARQAKGGELAVLLQNAFNAQTATEDVEQALAEARRKREQLEVNLATPGDYLEEVRRIIGHPQDFIRLSITDIKLSRMGIVMDNGNTEPVNDIRFAELEIANVLKRVVMLVSYPRDEMSE